jgi:hypothetical protein
MPKLTLSDRFVCALVGAVFGALYGVVIALIVAGNTDGIFSIAYVKTTSLVFAVLSFIIGPFIGDVFAAVIHFLVALFSFEFYAVSPRRLG